MFMFYDTETTGLIEYKKPNGDPSQPGIVQLAILLFDEDEKERGCFSSLVKPSGKEVSEGAERATGISTAIAEQFGIPLRTALSVWRMFRGMSHTEIAHNEPFDHRVMEIAHIWAKLDSPLLLAEGRERVCTMKLACPIVNLPPTDKMKACGMKKPKNPKLSECYEFFFNEVLEGAHDALVDVRATARVFFEMRRKSNGKQTETA